MSMETLNGLSTLSPTRINNGSGQHMKSDKAVNVQSVAVVRQAEPVHSVQRVATENEVNSVAKERQRTALNPESIEKLIEDVNEQPQIKQRALHFSIHEETGKTVVKIRDRDTNEVIRQIPSDQVIAIAERVHELLDEKGRGIMLQDQA